MARPGLFSSSAIDAATRAFAGAFALQQGTEIDLREQFDILVYGDSQNIPHGRWFIVRHARRNADGSRVDCSCKTPLSYDCDPDCPYCLGEGFLWDETWYKGYSMYVGPQGGMANRTRYVPGGDIRVDLKAIYLRYDTPMKHGDKLIEPLLDAEGAIVVPYIRAAIYDPQTVIDYRSDNGRIEYWAIFVKEDDALRPDVHKS